MGKKTPILPAWVKNIGTMIDGQGGVRVSCTKCDRGKRFSQADLIALAEKVGRDYSLVDRRCRCRLTPGCEGWNRFHYLNGVFYPLWTEKAVLRWWD